MRAVQCMLSLFIVKQYPHERSEEGISLIFTDFSLSSIHNILLLIFPLFLPFSFRITSTRLLVYVAIILSLGFFSHPDKLRERESKRVSILKFFSGIFPEWLNRESILFEWMNAFWGCFSFTIYTWICIVNSSRKKCISSRTKLPDPFTQNGEMKRQCFSIWYTSCYTCGFSWACNMVR